MDAHGRSLTLMDAHFSKDAHGRLCHAGWTRRSRWQDATVTVTLPNHKNHCILNLKKRKRSLRWKKLNNKMQNNFFYSESGLSASMLFKKLCETAPIYLNYKRIIKYTYRVNARVYTTFPPKKKSPRLGPDGVYKTKLKINKKIT